MPEKITEKMADESCVSMETLHALRRETLTVLQFGREWVLAHRQFDPDIWLLKKWFEQ